MRDGDPAGPDGTGAVVTTAMISAASRGMSLAGAGSGELLGDLTRLRRRARLARHGYWFPLVLFGVLGCAAAPLYLAAAASTPAGSGSYQTTGTGPLLNSGMPMGTKGFYIGWYWTVALVAGYLLGVVVLAGGAPGRGTHSVPRLP